MNILQILPELNVGGVETGVLDLSKRLVQSGHKAVVVSNGGRLTKALESYGVIHYQLPVHQKSLFTIIRMIRPLAEIIRKEEIDVVHARSRLPAWIAYFACRKTGKPLVTTCHGYYRRHLFSRAMGWAKFVITPSQVIAKHMVEDFGVPREKIIMIPRGVDLEKFTFIPPDKRISKEFHIGIIGRITPIKGHDYFLKAVAKLVQELNDAPIKVWIIGDSASRHDAYKYELQLLTKRLGLEDVVEFLGTQPDVPEIMNQLNLSVSATTIHEPFPRVIVESQAAGVPVVATKMGGVVDIVDDGKTGLLVAPQDPEALSKAMLRIIRDNALACRLASAAYEKAKAQFSLQLMVDRTIDVYKKAISNFRILVIKLSALGDMVLISPSLRLLRDKFPRDRYKITLLVNTPYQEIFFNCPYIDDLIVTNIKQEGFSSLLRLGEILRRRCFDLVIDFQNNHKSHILSMLSGVRDRYGYKRKFGFLLNHSVIDDKRVVVDPVEHQFRVLRLLGIESSDKHLELWPSKEDEVYVDNLLKGEWLSSHQALVGINLGHSVKWQTKEWPAGYIAELCDKLSSLDIRVVFLGSEEDLANCNAVTAQIKHAKPIQACGKTTVNQLAAMVKRCKVFLSADSAALHIACGVATPFVALFGPTDPKRHVSTGSKGIILTRDFPCQPCYKPRCTKPKCMSGIKPDEVIEAIKKLL